MGCMYDRVCTRCICMCVCVWCVCVYVYVCVQMYGVRMGCIYDRVCTRCICMGVCVCVCVCVIGLYDHYGYVKPTLPQMNCVNYSL